MSKDVSVCISVQFCNITVNIFSLWSHEVSDMRQVNFRKMKVGNFAYWFNHIQMLQMINLRTTLTHVSESFSS